VRDNTRLKDSDPEIYGLVLKETERKEYSLELIPSENIVSRAVQEVCGTILTDKYCEGYPGKRYYGGCQFHDEIENIAIDRAKSLFGVEAVNVQPHSGANANMAVYFAYLQPGDTILAPRLDHGGHLTHGSPVNFSGKLYKIAAYGVDPETELFNTDEVRKLAHEHKPKIIVSGATAYSRKFDWAEFRKIADEVGALLMADIAHYAGLVAGGAYPSPVGHAHIVTTTTHKTLRGPRGGMIMTDTDRIKAINTAVFPRMQGGPLMHQIAGKAVAFKEANTPEFKKYAQQVVDNARALSSCLLEHGVKIVSGGTDSHVMMINLKNHARTGAEIETALGRVGITVNKNTVPNDTRPAAVTSGIRIGTPAITTRGFGVKEMAVVADCIHRVIENYDDEAKLKAVRDDVISLCKQFPLFPADIND
jgi:glycine hydroxymethyltransferase